MTFDVRIRPEAEQDMAEAALWYEQQQRGLGQDFLDEALAVFMRLAEMPLGYELVIDLPAAPSCAASRSRYFILLKRT